MTDVKPNFSKPVFDLITSFAPDDLSTVATGPGGGRTTNAFDFETSPVLLLEFKYQPDNHIVSC